MISYINTFLITSVAILYFMLPAYIANGSGLAFGGETPVDFKKTMKNTRIIGDGVTWRGLIIGTIIGTIIGIIQGYIGSFIIQNFGAYITTPVIVNLNEGILIGFLLGFGALVGDALGSFLKRRIGIERGKPAPFLDQLDFLIIAILFTSFVVKFSIEFIIISIVLTFIIHLLANTFAYLIGIKDVWY